MGILQPLNRMDRPKPRNKFNKAEDKSLLSLVLEFHRGTTRKQTVDDIATTTSWHVIAEDMNQMHRCDENAENQLNGKQCRERFLNHVDPSLDKSPFSEEDERTIIRLHTKHGNKWADIARDFPRSAEGLRRAENAIKNVFKSSERNNKGEGRGSSILANYTRSLSMSVEEPTAQGEKPTRQPARHRLPRDARSSSRLMPTTPQVLYQQHQAARQSRRLKQEQPASAASPCGSSLLDGIKIIAEEFAEEFGSRDDVESSGDDWGSCISLHSAGLAVELSSHDSFSSSCSELSEFPKTSPISYSGSVSERDICDSLGSTHPLLYCASDDDLSSAAKDGCSFDLDLVSPNDLPFTPAQLERSSTDAWHRESARCACRALSYSAENVTVPYPDLAPPAWRSSRTASIVESCEEQILEPGISYVSDWPGPIPFASSMLAEGSSGADVADQLLQALHECCEKVQQKQEYLNWEGHITVIACPSPASPGMCGLKVATTSTDVNTAWQVGYEVYDAIIAYEPAAKAALSF